MITTSLSPLYKVKLIADGRTHFYELENDPTWRPGVTQVLSVMDKPALIPWAVKSVSDNIRESLLARNGNPLTAEEIEKIVTDGKNIYKKKASDAADLGTRVHKAVDALIHGQTPEITDDIRAGVDGFIKWKETNDLKIEMGDSKIASRLFGYGGSLDFMAFNKAGEPIIFDLKTTRKRRDRDHGIYPEYGTQLAAYSQAFKETFGIPVKAVYALWVDKENAGFKALKVTNLNASFETFLACLKIYNSRKIEVFDEAV